MSHRPAVLGRAWLIAAAVSVTSLSACSKGKESADSTRLADSTAKAASPAPAPVSALAARPATVLPGALQKPIGEYTADEFYAFANSLSFGGGDTKPRKCKNNPACDPKVGKQTSARVDAVDGQDSLSAAAIGPNGAIVVHAKNTGQYEEERYGLKPGDFEYYVVVYPPAAGGNATWRLEQVETTTGAMKLTEVANGTFHPCNHPFRKVKKYRANFWTCENSPHDSTMKMGLMQGGFMDPIWVSCAQGCCTVGG